MIIKKNDTDKVIIFGTGGNLLLSLKFLKKNNLDVAYLSDNNVDLHNTLVNNIKVISPEEIKNYDFPVLIISMYASDIAKQLKDLKIKEYYDFSYVFDYDRWKEHFNIKLLEENVQKINEVSNLLEDEESKIVFNSLIKYRQTSNPIYIKKANYVDYFHPIVSPEENDVIIDGGAWKGDSCLDFNTKLKENCKIYSFEPDNNNYKILSENTKLYENIVPVKFGLSDKNDILYFSESTHDMQHQIVEYETNIKIEVLSLDNFIKNKEIINFIKMDIEGSEVQALIGAKELLEKQKPKLAICIYHLYNDLWEIPLLIKSINPSYKLYMGHHSQNLLDTVIYAI